MCAYIYNCNIGDSFCTITSLITLDSLGFASGSRRGVLGPILEGGVPFWASIWYP